MSKEQIINLEPNLGMQVSQSFRRQQKVYDPILCNPRPSNSANYIPIANSQHHNSTTNSRQLPIFNPHNTNINTSQLTHTSQHSNNILTAQQLSAYQKLSQLTQRLKNIHHFYKLRIQQEKLKNSQRNYVFMNIVEQLQRNHNERVNVIKSEIQCVEEDKRRVGSVDERMEEIKLSIDQLLTQSASYKSSNQQLQKQITIKQQSLKQKQKQLEKVIKQEKEIRDQLEEFVKQNIKQNKKQMEMLQMIDKIGDVSG